MKTALAHQALSGLPVGSTATVTGLAQLDSDPCCRRLRDLGFLPGTPVTAVRRAPLGDPTVFEIRGYQVALRRTESAKVVIASHPAGEYLPV